MRSVQYPKKSIRTVAVDLKRLAESDEGAKWASATARRAHSQWRQGSSLMGFSPLVRTFDSQYSDGYEESCNGAANAFATKFGVP